MWRPFFIFLLHFFNRFGGFFSPARYKDEFTGSMTCTVKLTDQHGQMKKTRIFSLRGSHLVAMFARTEKAKAFRRWVLDILDAIHNGSEYVRRQHEAALKAMEIGDRYRTARRLN